MLNEVLAWMMVAVAGLAFAGFLFGFAAILTRMERALRSAGSVPLGLERPGRSTARLWA